MVEHAGHRGDDRAHLGKSALNGYVGGPPLNSGQMYPDAVAGLTGCAAILTAIHHRDRTGEGQYIDLSMQEANLAFVGRFGVGVRDDGAATGAWAIVTRICAARDVPVRGATSSGWRSPAKRASSGARCVASRGRAGNADSRFASNAARKANEEKFDAAISGWTRRERETSRPGYWRRE